MEPNLLVLFVVGALLVLNGLLGNARIPQADDQETTTSAAEADEDSPDDSGSNAGADEPALKLV